MSEMDVLVDSANAARRSRISPHIIERYCPFRQWSRVKQINMEDYHYVDKSRRCFRTGLYT